MASVQVRAFLGRFSGHGFAYLAPSTPSRRLDLERLVWVSAVVASLALFATMTYSAYRDDYDNPIVTNVLSVPVSEVAFPCVTVSSGSDILKEVEAVPNFPNRFFSRHIHLLHHEEALRLPAGDVQLSP